jgi:biotin transport system ATP-binding protein
MKGLPEPNTIPLFSLRNVSKIFPGVLSRDSVSLRVSGTESGFRAVSNINLEIRESECLVLAGSNGSGKTILMRCLAALMDISEGEIFYRGTPLSKAAGLRRELGIIFQDTDAQIIGETIEEDLAFGLKNIGLSKKETSERAAAALENFGLAGKKSVPPRRLSGGEKRRLAAAGVVAMGCQTLIMDEPFANLDYPGVVQVLEVIRDLKSGGKNLIILTHELEKVLAYADRLVILHRGIIRDDGKAGDVLNRLDPAWGVRDPRQNCAGVKDCTWL